MVSFLRNIIQTEGLVLRTRNYKEADQLLTLYTNKVGKVNAIVKGVRKTKSKLRGGVQLFSHTNLSLYLGKGLATVTQAEPIDSFMHLKTDLGKITYASYLAELIDSFILEKEPDPHLFQIVLKTFNLLTDREPFIIMRWAEMNILSHLGYQPCLTNCVECGNEKLNCNNIYFYPHLGGIACPQCQKNLLNYKRVKVSGETVVILQRLLELDLKILERLKTSALAEKEMENILEEYITYILGKQLKSKSFLNNIASIR